MVADRFVEEFLPFQHDAWRVFRIISEFVDGFETLIELGPSVSIFGSARLPSTSPYYELSFTVAKELVSRGFSIITGGGPAMMEAANKGAQAANGKSCGLRIDLPDERSANPFVDKNYELNFRYFFVRKVMFIRYAQGYVFLPGGLGTCDELFEALTLIQKKRIHGFPIYLIGSDFWKGLIDWFVEKMVGEGCLAEEHLQLFKVTDDPIEVATGIEKHYRETQSLKNF